MPDLIVAPKKSGQSKEMTVAGALGFFDWDRPPVYLKNVGKGNSPLYLFKQKDGEQFWRRLEKDKQGGRWEESGQKTEYDAIRKDPESAYRKWGKTPVADMIMKSAVTGATWEELPDILRNFNTWRQISED